MEYVYPPLNVLDPLGKGLDYYKKSTINRRIRSYRLKLAKQKGDHKLFEWEEMKLFFENKCCSCNGESGLINVELDHIVPIYLGGSNGINNIQPLCALCNIKKGGNVVDYRPDFCKLLNKQLPLKYISL